MVRIARESPLTPDGIALIAAGQAALEDIMPPEEIFSMDPAGLEGPRTDFLVARDDAGPLGCVALVDMGGYGEVKRLFTLPRARGTGMGRRLMLGFEEAARARGLSRLLLETGPDLHAALGLYESLGYLRRGPYGDYADIPASVFMEKRLPLSADAPRRMLPDEGPQVLDLILSAFAFMEGRIDPPSSMHRMQADDLVAQNQAGEVWIVGPHGAPLASMVLTPKVGRLYLGRVAVSSAARGKGYARLLIATAGARARALGHSQLELQSRIELTDNHRIFSALGFTEYARTAHEGYDRPTSVTFRKPV